jgi:hypothetical protein
MRSSKTWALAFVIATGAFWYVMANRPPQAIAADPTSSVSPLSLPTPEGLRSVWTDGGYHFGQAD